MLSKLNGNNLGWKVWSQPNVLWSEEENGIRYTEISPLLYETSMPDSWNTYPWLRTIVHEEQLDARFASTDTLAPFISRAQREFHVELNVR
jgi:hypothetical protein